MIDRKELAEEFKLREGVRQAIRHVLSVRSERTLIEENKLRGVIQKLVEAQAAVAAVAKHDSTGINALEDLLRNTNVLSTLETGYKSLTTTKQQRESYRNHILNAVDMSLAPEESRKGAGEDEELGAPKQEAVDITIDDSPENDPAFIDVNDDEVEVDEPDERTEFGIEGEDKTGRNRAFTDFKDIEKNILTAFDDLDNPEDIRMFEEYLIKNLALYFDKFEDELQTNVEEPAVAQSASPDAAEVPAPDLETDVPEFELEEGSEINLESLIDSLLQ